MNSKQPHAPRPGARPAAPGMTRQPPAPGPSQPRPAAPGMTRQPPAPGPSKPSPPKPVRQPAPGFSRPPTESPKGPGSQLPPTNGGTHPKVPTKKPGNKTEDSNDESKIGSVIKIFHKGANKYLTWTDSSQVELKEFLHDDASQKWLWSTKGFIKPAQGIADNKSLSIMGKKVIVEKIPSLEINDKRVEPFLFEYVDNTYIRLKSDPCSFVAPYHDQKGVMCIKTNAPSYKDNMSWALVTEEEADRRQKEESLQEVHEIIDMVQGGIKKFGDDSDLLWMYKDTLKKATETFVEAAARKRKRG